MLRAPVAWVFPFLILAATAQEAPKPTRSLAAGLLRQQVEIGKLELPRAKDGLEIGKGDGPMVMLVRHRDGTLTAHDLQRGGGEHGPAAKPSQAVQEERPVDGPEVPSPPQLQLTFADGVLTVMDGSKPLQQGKALDAGALREPLAAKLAAAKGAPYAGVLELDCRAAVPMQHVLAVWEIARAAGFEHVQFHGNGPKPLAAADQEMIAGLAQKAEWPVRHAGPHGALSITDGELLLVLDGPALWGDIEPLIYAFAKAGIWQFGFACRKDATTFVKLPTSLPVDKGM